MHSKKELDLRLTQAGVQPLKKLGQNFLVNPTICERIIEASLNTSEGVTKTLVEIGPGLGALTDAWDKISHVTLVEIDSGLVEFWKTRLQQAGVAWQIIHADALKVDWEQFKSLEGPRVLVSNLPYGIAASLVVELSSNKPVFERMVLMFQKEVGIRLQAKPGDEDYGMLSVMAQAAWEIKKLMDAGPHDFHPIPNVGSRVLVFEAKERRLDHSKLLRVVKQAFIQRRKKLVSNLSGVFPKEKSKAVLSSMGFNDNTRAEELSVENFIKLASEL